MKEFKFWAIPYSIQLLLIGGLPISILSFILISYINIDIEKFFFFFFAGSIILNVLTFVFIVKRVKVCFSADNEMSIYYYGREKYKATREKLESISGANIADPKGRGELKLVFSDRQFTFSILESNSPFSSSASKQVELLRYMTAIYSLEKEPHKKIFVTQVYKYQNPQYKESPNTKGNYNKSER